MLQTLLLASPHLFVSGAVLVIVAFASSTLWKALHGRITAPVLGKDDSYNFTKTMLKAWNTHRREPYVIPDFPSVMILPVHHLDEIKSLPENKISLTQELRKRFRGDYTRIGTHDQTLIDIIKADLTRSIAHTLDALQDEMKHAAHLHIGPCKDWTSIPVHAAVLDMVALMSGRVFVGLPLSRDPEFIEATKAFTADAFGASVKINNDGVMGLIKGYFLPEIRALKRSEAKVMRLLAPVVTEKLEALNGPDPEPPTDMIDFVIRGATKKNRDLAYIRDMQVQLSFLAMHTTSTNLTQVLFDLAARPEYMQPLREELDMVLNATNGVLEKTSIVKLRKLDSFMRESMRINAPSSITMQRLTTSDLQLSGGLYIPKGTSFAMSANGINRDVGRFPDADSFDGFRFAKLRDLPGSESKHQFVTTGVDNINFGHGSHACPGRFFASNEIKVALAYIVQQYDLKVSDGQGRPQNAFHSTHIYPDFKASVMFKKR